MKYRDLLEKLSGFTEEQLDQPVNVALCDAPLVQIKSIWIVEEDYINPSGEGAEPISAYAGDPDYEGEPVVVKKGEIFLIDTDEKKRDPVLLPEPDEPWACLLLRCLIGLVQECHSGNWRVSLDYNNYQDGARVLDGDGNVLAECYDSPPDDLSQFWDGVKISEWQFLKAIEKAVVEAELRDIEKNLEPEGRKDVRCTCGGAPDSRHADDCDVKTMKRPD